MNSMKQLYSWTSEIGEWLPLKKWQALGLALFSLGVVWSEHVWLSKVAERLWMVGKADTVERRLQRWLANPRIDLAACCRAWSKWVFSQWIDGQRIILLVDLTKLSDRMDILMVGLAYRQRCIPLAWRCLPGNQPWPIGQVEVIAELLSWVAAGVPTGQVPIVEADRGLSNSVQLMTVVSRMGWYFLFRLRGTTTLRCADGEVRTLASLIQRGRQWQGQGELFTSRQPVAAYIHLHWPRAMTEPWCLATNSPEGLGKLYAARVWQEEGFRDLKSGGWRWQQSLLRCPAHAERLLLVLALAYGWVVSLGTQAIRLGKSSLRQLTRGHRRRYSVFRLGLRYLHALQAQRRPLPMSLFFRPDLSAL